MVMKKFLSNVMSRAVVWLLFFSVGAVMAGPLSGNRWELLEIVYPPDRSMSIYMCGSDKTLTATGECKIKWQKGTGSLELEIKGLPSPNEAGWGNRQYVLWALDRDKHIANLGVVPLRGKNAKWSVQTAFRTFGLLITAEQDPKAPAPSTAVAMESLLPTDPDLVVPVYRVEIDLGPRKG